MRLRRSVAMSGIVLLLAVGCASNNKVGKSVDLSAQRDFAPLPPSDEGVGAKGPVSELGVAPDTAPVPIVPQRVIRNANLEVKVTKGSFQRQFSKANMIAESVGGFVSNSETSSTGDEIISGSVTLRIPAAKFQTALSQLKKLGKVTSEGSSGNDVTREFVDLEARLRHLKSQEEFYLKLLAQSKTIADLVQVQSQLSNIQLQIEQIQGQLLFLKDQTDMSTITARIYEPSAEKKPRKGLGKAWNQAVDAFLSVIYGIFPVVGALLPLVIVAGIVLFLIRYFRNQRKPKPPSP